MPQPTLDRQPAAARPPAPHPQPGNAPLPAARRPEAYAVARRPRALAYRAGQAWEQLALPLRARRLGARLVLSPANLAPLGWPGNVVVIHDAVVLTHPEWFSSMYAAWHRRA